MQQVRPIKSRVHVSESSVECLTLTTYACLKPNVQTKDVYLLLEIMQPVVMMTGLEITAQDHTGTTCTVMAYSYISSGLDCSPQQMLPVGTKFILKEPFLDGSTPKRYFLCCNSPTDIVIITLNNAYVDISSKTQPGALETANASLGTLFNGQSCAEWKKRGDECFQQKLYHQSVEAYTVAIGLSEIATAVADIFLAIHLGLAATYFRLGFYEKVLQHCEQVLLKDPRNAKGLCQAVHAHYELHQYQLAKNCFSLLIPSQENPTVGKELSDKCSKRLAEQTTGVNIYRLFLHAKLKPGTPVDVAEYKGSFTVTPVPGKGRGAVATKDLVPGTLVLVCKAFQSTLVSLTSGDALQDKYHQNATVSDGYAHLMTEIIQAVIKNPTVFGQAVYDLSSCDKTLDSAKRYCNELTQEEPIANVERLRRIVKYNAFGINGTSGESNGVGLFITAAYFNHSCVPNANWKIYNDVMVIHSIKPIAEGEEITIAYDNADNKTFKEREECFKQRKFVCTCNLCELDRNEPKSVQKTREHLINAERQTRQQFASCPTGEIVQRHADAIQELQRSYRQRSRFQMSLFLPFMFQACLALTMGSRESGFAYLERAFAALGVCLESLINCAKKGELVIFESDAVFSSDGLSTLLEAAIVAANRDNNVSLARDLLAGLELLQRVTCGSTRLMVKGQFDKIPVALFD